MGKYIVILSLFLTSCNFGSKPYKVRIIDNNTSCIIYLEEGYAVGDTIIKDFKYTEGPGIHWIEQKAVITKKIEK